ncbi:hybrid sensor histidine kinase/response regulator transcription factor [Coprobacter sp.]
MKRYFVVGLITAYFSICCNILCADDIYFSKLGMTQGLSHPSVMSIYQDESGSFWFGTREGLNCYNQNGMQVFTPEPSNPNSLCGERIRQICGDRNGKVFILTNRGISEYDLKTNNFLTLKENVCTAVSYGYNRLWIAEYNRLFIYKDGCIESFFQFPSRVNISAVRELKNGCLVVGTLSSGVYYLDRNKRITQLLPDIGRVSVVYEDSKNDVWIGSYTKGLYCFQDTRLAEHYCTAALKEECRLSSDFVRDVCEDNRGDIWIGTSLGINRLDEDRQCLEVFDEGERDSRKLSDRSVWSLYKDVQGTIWIGTYYGGVNYFNPEIKSYNYLDLQYPGKEKASAPIVGGIIKDEHENLFLCTEGEGVIYYDVEKKQCEQYSINSPRNQYLFKSNIKAAYYDENNHILWLGLHFGGLCKFNVLTREYTIFDEYHYSRDMVGDAASIRVIKPYKKDFLLVGTHSGLYLFDMRTNKFSLFSERLHKYNPFVVDILFDKKQNLWVAGKGLLYFDVKTGEIKEYLYDPKEETSLSSNNMEKLFRDSQDRLWVTTGGGGLNLYDEKNDYFHRFDQRSCGLKNNYIGNIAESKNGHLILLHTEGISLFDPRNKKVYNYGVENGFPLSSAYGGDICITSDGQIYLSGIDGVVSFTEKDLKQEYKPFKIELQELLVNNRRIVPGDSTGILKSTLAFTKKIKLKYDQTILSISFISDNYIPSNRCVYEYQMSGLSNQWVKIPPHVYTLNFMHLAEGDYTLKIRGKWEGTQQIACEKQLMIHVSPPFFRSWWAYLIYVLVIISLIYIYLSSAKSKLLLKTSLEYEKKEKDRIEQTNQSKLRFFTNISHEFRTPLTLILGQVDMLLQTSRVSPVVYRKILAIKRNASHMQNLITELLEFRKYEQGHLILKVSQINVGDFLDEIYVSFTELARLRNITFKLEKTEKDTFIWIDPLQMQKVFYNLISNAFKFTSEQGCIIIEVKETDERVFISVKDNGIGISEEHIDKIFGRFYQVDNNVQVSNTTPGTGIGLALSKLIVEAHSGNISVSSVPEVESCFVVSLRKGKSHFNPSQISEGGNADQICIKKISEFETDIVAEIVRESGAYESSSKPTILIVEDNMELRLMLKEIFSPVYNVILAVDGKDGFEKVEELQPDIVVSDIMMPFMSGSDLCRKIKESQEFCHIPVVLLTARTTIESNIEGLKNGADDYVTKPFNVETLIIRCNNLVNNRRILQKKFSFQPNTSAKVLATNEQDLVFIEKVCSVIEEHIDDPEFDVPVLCAELNMGRTKLFAKLKGVAGQTPNDFILNVKLKKASVFLRDNMEMSVADIAYTLGFGSPKYFGKCFKDQFGVSPTAYRKGSPS